MRENLDFSEETLKTAAVFLTPAVAYFYATAPIGASSILFVCLWVLSVYDWLTYRLPNQITAAFFLAGVLYLVGAGPDDKTPHVIGAVVGLLFFPLLNFLYKAVRGRNGVGMGDAKLLAGIGLWLGWPSLPFVLLVASVLGLLYALLTQVSNGAKIATLKIPFGPFLCLGCWVVWLFF